MQIHLHKAFFSDDRFLDSFLNQTNLDLRKEKWIFLNREFTVSSNVSSRFKLKTNKYIFDAFHFWCLGGICYFWILIYTIFSSFVAFAKERVADQGLSALDLSLEFDEKRVLEDNLNYLLNTLEMEGVDVKFSSEASEKIQEDCRPGNTMEITN